jgi:hypothetical protein
MSRFIIFLVLALVLVSCAPLGFDPSLDVSAGERELHLLWPADGESVDARPVLQWDVFPEAANYRVTVVNTETGATIFTGEGIERQMPMTTALPGETDYTWTVSAYDVYGDLIARSQSTFWVRDELRVVSPAGGATVGGRPTLQWESFPGANSYQIVVVDDDAFPPVVVADMEMSQTTFALRTALEPGSYSWTVWAKDTNGRVLAELASQFSVER